MKTLIALLLTFTSIQIYAQINTDDSTAQAIAYWNLNEKQTFAVSEVNNKIVGTDTTLVSSNKYLVDVSIVDSTANSYTIDWFCHDYQVETSEELEKKLMSLLENLTIRIKTDEYGVFQEVVNWEEISGIMQKGIKLMKKEYKDIPNADKVFDQVGAMFENRETIENAAIDEMLQFYYFNGAKYELGQDYGTTIKLPNIYGGDPLDAEIVFWLDEINADDNNYILRMHQSVDPDQLSNATYKYLVNIAQTMNVEPIKEEDMPTVSNDVWIASRIHGSGWLIYSIKTKVTEAQGETQTEERIIEIQ